MITRLSLWYTLVSIICNGMKAMITPMATNAYTPMLKYRIVVAAERRNG